MNSFRSNQFQTIPFIYANNSSDLRTGKDKLFKPLLLLVHCPPYETVSKLVQHRQKQKGRNKDDLHPETVRVEQ